MGSFIVADPLKIFSLLKKIFNFFAVKLVRFISNYFFCICSKHASLTAQDQKNEDKKFYSIGSSSCFIMLLK